MLSKNQFDNMKPDEVLNLTDVVPGQQAQFWIRIV
jgi:hypothetical protein